jgi:predicted RNA-binding Zn-ribbon protein involved in translation (DUF1610 family)
MENKDTCLWTYHRSCYEQIDPSYYTTSCSKEIITRKIKYCPNCGKEIEVKNE